MRRQKYCLLTKATTAAFAASPITIIYYPKYGICIARNSTEFLTASRKQKRTRCISKAPLHSATAICGKRSSIRSFRATEKAPSINSRSFEYVYEL